MALAMATAAATLLTGACGGPGPEATDLSPQAAEGLEVARRYNCTGCHSTDGSDSVGPTWAGLYGSEVELVGGATVVADDPYLRRSIVDPTAEVVEGFRSTMPTQDLDDEQVEAAIAYIRELAG